MTSPESAPFDLDRIVDALALHDVRYVVIGGTSGLLHGAVEHVTRDVDVLIRADRHNRHRLAEALTDLGAVSDHPIDEDDFAGNTQWETDAGPVDVLVTSTGPDETILVYADIESSTRRRPGRGCSNSRSMRRVAKATIFAESSRSMTGSLPVALRVDGYRAALKARAHELIEQLTEPHRAVRAACRKSCVKCRSRPERWGCGSRQYGLACVRDW